MLRARASDGSELRTRSRSRSPYRESSHSHSRHKSRRSRSPRRDEDKRREKKRKTRSPPPKPVVLPYKAKPLSKRQYDEYKPLFQSYLDIQKQIFLDDLDEREVKGRWKSFVSRWNRGDLARSWYDPTMLKSAQEKMQSFQATSSQARTKRDSPSYGAQGAAGEASDDEFGPAPPTSAARHQGHGPTIPRLDDLTYRNEMRHEDQARNRSDYVSDLRHERKGERALQTARLDELAPRADPGSRERQLEKKRETTSTLQSFRDAKEGGDVEVAEADLLGDDGIDGYKKKKRDEQRKMTEREIRREEIARAREAERNERLSERREKEEKTMEFLKQLARDNFG